VIFHYTTFYEIYQLCFRVDFQNQCKLAYQEYNAMIKGLVPKYQVAGVSCEEWVGTSCKWLEKEVPKTDVPSGNMGVGFVEARFEIVQ
jgi:hypothetical protein